VTDHPHPVDPERVAGARARALGNDEALALRALLGVIGDPVRARVLTALAPAEEMCVGDVAIALGISEDAASYALRTLLDHGLVRRRREGRMGYYRLADGERHGPLVAAIKQLAGLSLARPDGRPPTP
jgi:DNA-binding transcriptional ArsR family regulator